MKHLKLYQQFRLILEKIENLDRISGSSDNELIRSLGGNDEIKECIETIFPNQNLKYLSAGGVGLTFQWLENSADMIDDFYQVGLTGKKCDIKNKCIKITMSESEANQIKSRVGKHDEGLCEYFWVKETKWKNKKIYLICMDFLDMPTIEQKMVIHLIFLLTFPDNYLHDKIDDKLKKLLEWLKSENPEYSELEFDEKFKDKITMKLQKGLKKDTLVSMFCARNKIEGKEAQVIESWKKMDDNFFMNLSKNVLKIFQIAKNKNLKVDDIHENNMGYRKELVALDFI